MAGCEPPAKLLNGSMTRLLDPDGSSHPPADGSDGSSIFGRILCARAPRTCSLEVRTISVMLSRIRADKENPSDPSGLVIDRQIPLFRFRSWFELYPLETTAMFFPVFGVSAFF